MNKIIQATTSLTITETGNESYRFQHSTMTAKSRIKSREQKRKGSKEISPDEPF